MSPNRTMLSAAEGQKMDDQAVITVATIFEDLNELAKKPYGWNGGIDLPVRQDVIEEMTHRLLGTYGIDFRRMPPPSVHLNQYGNITLQFDRAHKTLTVMVICGRVVRIVREYLRGMDSYTIGKIVRLPTGNPATGYAVEVDDAGDWLLDLG